MTILKIHATSPDAAHLMFEYHPRTGKVYVMPRPLSPGQRVEAEVLAEHCDSHGRAIGFVQTFCRGIRAGLAMAAAPGRDRPILVGV